MQIDVELPALKQFGAALHDLTRELARQRQNLASEAEGTRSFWSGDSYARHKAFLSEMLSEIQGFEKACDNMVDFLDQKYAAGLRAL